jgi:hypothetical protein
VKGARLSTRLNTLSKRLGHYCPGCAGRVPVETCLFRYGGVLMNGHSEPVDESVLLPCPACGKGGVAKTVEGVDPGLMLGVHVIEGVDPSRV